MYRYLDTLCAVRSLFSSVLLNPSFTTMKTMTTESPDLVGVSSRDQVESTIEIIQKGTCCLEQMESQAKRVDHFTTETYPRMPKREHCTKEFSSETSEIGVEGAKPRAHKETTPNGCSRIMDSRNGRDAAPKANDFSTYSVRTKVAKQVLFAYWGELVCNVLFFVFIKGIQVFLLFSRDSLD